MDTACQPGANSREPGPGGSFTGHKLGACRTILHCKHTTRKLTRLNHSARKKTAPARATHSSIMNIMLGRARNRPYDSHSPARPTAAHRQARCTHNRSVGQSANTEASDSDKLESECSEVFARHPRLQLPGGQGTLRQHCTISRWPSTNCAVPPTPTHTVTRHSLGMMRVKAMTTSPSRGIHMGMTKAPSEANTMLKPLLVVRWARRVGCVVVAQQ